MDFEKIMIHMLNPEKNELTISNQIVENMSEEVMASLENKVQMAFLTSRKRSSSRIPNLEVLEILQNYKDENITFEELSEALSKLIYAKKLQHSLYNPCDIVITEGVQDKRRFLVVSENSYVHQISHNIDNSGDDVEVRYVQSEGMVSNHLLKKDAVVFLELSDMSAIVVEDRITVEGYKLGFYGDLLLELERNVTLQDASKIYRNTLFDVAKTHQIDPVKVVPKMKQLVKEFVEDEDNLVTETIASAVLYDFPMAKDDFVYKVKQAGIEDEIPTAHTTIAKSDKVIKFKSDKGTELTLPTTMVEDPLYTKIEHIEEDDTYTITLKFMKIRKT